MCGKFSWTECIIYRCFHMRSTRAWLWHQTASCSRSLVGPSIRPICTRWCCTMTSKIQVRSNFHRARVLIIGRIWCWHQTRATLAPSPDNRSGRGPRPPWYPSIQPIQSIYATNLIRLFNQFVPHPVLQWPMWSRCVVIFIEPEYWS